MYILFLFWSAIFTYANVVNDIEVCSLDSQMGLWTAYKSLKICFFYSAGLFVDTFVDLLGAFGRLLFFFQLFILYLALHT